MKLLALLLFIPLYVNAQDFPSAWWTEIPRSEAASWEILPQDASPGEVILSKRTELGIFSNFGDTPFVLDGDSFASLEGLWQSLKYPDPMMRNDPRSKVFGWPYTRNEVQALTGFEAKAAGEDAKKIYAKNSLKNVSWKGFEFDYLDFDKGSEFHYQLIYRASVAKLNQNPGLWDLLLKTKCLKLKPDHQPGSHEPPAYRYYDIYMKLRDDRLHQDCSKN
jgi:hypothetical protein